MECKGQYLSLFEKQKQPFYLIIVECKVALKYTGENQSKTFYLIIVECKGWRSMGHKKSFKSFLSNHSGM